MKVKIIILVIFFTLLLMCWFINVNSSIGFKGLQSAIVVFDTTEINLGVLKQGNPQLGTFIFTNAGDTPFIISNIIASCGCTKPEWPRHPILPGNTGIIKITYDAQRIGHFLKRVRVEGNVEGGCIVLFVKGEVYSTQSDQVL